MAPLGNRVMSRSRTSWEGRRGENGERRNGKGKKRKEPIMRWDPLRTIGPPGWILLRRTSPSRSRPTSVGRRATGLQTSRQPSRYARKTCHDGLHRAKLYSRTTRTRSFDNCAMYSVHGTCTRKQNRSHDSPSCGHVMVMPPPHHQP